MTNESILKVNIALLVLLIVAWLGGIFYVVFVVAKPSTYYYQTNGLSMSSYFAEQDNNQLIALAMASVAGLMIPVVLIVDYVMQLKDNWSSSEVLEEKK